MTTHWDRITDESYRQWLIDRQVIAEEFNNWRFLERNEARSEFEKQQQQQQPNAPAAQPPTVAPMDRRQVIASNSMAIYEGWSRDLVNYNFPPTEDALRNAVQAELPNALPTSQVWAAGADQPVSDVIMEENVASKAMLSAELEMLKATILSMTYHGDTEDATHSSIDSLILNPIKHLCLYNRCTIATNRNGVDSSGATLNSLRPDVLLWLPSGVLALKGEDKAFGVDIDQAREDLRRKMNVFSETFFGTVPYQLAYACSGSILEFRAFMRTDNPHRPREIRLTGQIDLKTLVGRSLCVRYAVNIARILVALDNGTSGSVISLGRTVQTRSSKVMIVGEYVTKKTSDYSEETVLTELYEAVRKAEPPHLIRSMYGPKFSRNTLSVNLTPVGFCGSSPSTIDECKIAARAILCALQWLHENGFVHRDIRSLNVMRANGTWFLIDLEWANYEKQPLEDYNPTLRPPESHQAGFHWAASADMWQFGKLLESWNRLDDDGLNLVRRLLHDDYASRPNAREALQHAFITNAE